MTTWGPSFSKEFMKIADGNNLINRNLPAHNTLLTSEKMRRSTAKTHWSRNTVSCPDMRNRNFVGHYSLFCSWLCEKNVGFIEGIPQQWFARDFVLRKPNRATRFCYRTHCFCGGRWNKRTDRATLIVIPTWDTEVSLQNLQGAVHNVNKLSVSWCLSKNSLCATISSAESTTTKHVFEHQSKTFLM